MSKRDRHLKQRLDELFSASEPQEPQPGTPTTEPAAQPPQAAQPIEPAAGSPADPLYLKAMINELQLPAYLKDREHTWLAVNTAFAQLINRAPEALTGHSDTEQADEAWQLDDRVLDGGQAETSEETIILPDGSSHIRQIKRVPLKGADQTVHFVFGLVQELTTPARDTYSPDDTTAFGSAMDAMPSPVIISRIADDAIVYANPAFSQFTGVPLTQLLGQPTLQFYAEASDRARVVAGVQQHDELHGFEVLLRRADGSRLWVSLSTRRMAFNTEACVITTLEDISERKQTEANLMKFQQGLEHSTAAIFITDRAGVITYVNPAFEKIYGYKRDEAVGQTPRIIKSGLIPPEQYQQFWATLLSGHTVAGEVTNKAKDGRLIPIDGSNNPIFDESGNIIGFLALHTDVSLRKQAEEDLLKRNRQLALFNRVGQELAQLVTVQEVVEHTFEVVGEVLSNRDMYLALFDDHQQEISFPIYTVAGERREVAAHSFGSGMTEHVLRSRQTLWIPRDVQAFADSGDLADSRRLPHCYLGAPLLSGDKAVGVIALQNYDHEDAFTTADIELLSALAAQVAAALETVRLYAAESRRALQLQTAAEVSTAAGTVLSVDELLPFVVNLIQERFGLYYVGLFLVDSTHHKALLRAGTGEAGRRMLERGHQLSVDDRSMIGWSIQQQVPRVALDVGEDAVHFSNPDLPDTRSELALPLVSRGQVLGAMTVQSTVAAAFSEQDIAILQTMSDQVATAIANAQLFEQAEHARQQAEARLRETEFLQNVGKAISSSLDLTTVLDVVMDALQHDLGFTHNALALLDKRANTIVIARAAGTAADLQGLTRPVDQMRDDIVMDILRRGEIEVIDGWDDRFDRQIYDSQGHAALVRAFVPLRVRSESIGLLEVGYRRAERARISPEEVRLLGGLADQIAIAVENARLFNESQQRITELAVVNEISRTLTVAQDVQQLFATIHEQVGRLYDATNFYIATYDGGEDWSLDYQFEHGQLLPPARHKLGSGFTSYILRTRQHVLIRSAQENVAFHQRQGLPQIGETAKSWMGVPLIVGGSIIGVMGIQSYEQANRYTDHDLALFSTIGTQAASAIQNARLFQEARLRATELTALNDLSQTLAAQLNVNQVLHEVWQGVSRLLDTTNFYIALYNPEREEISFPINASESVLDKEIEVMPADKGLTGYIIRTRLPLLITENTAQRVKELGLENVGGDSQSYLGVPLILGDQVLGVIAIQSYDRARLYSKHDQDLLLAIASQATIALQNARLFEQTQSQARETAAINDILLDVSQHQPLDHILETAYHHLRELLPAEACIVAMVDAAANRLWYPLIYDNDQRYPPAEGDITHSTTINQVILTGQPILIHRQPHELLRLGSNSPTALGNVDQPSASLLYVPLLSEQKVIGALSVQSYQPYAYNNAHLELVQRIANQLGVAVQNVKLFEQIKENADQLGALNALGQIVAQQIEVEQVLEVTYHQLQPLVPMDAFFAALYDRETDTIALPVIYDEGHRYSEPAGPFNATSRTGQVITSGVPNLLLLTSDEIANMAEVSGALGNVEKPSASLLYVPLTVGAQTIGALSIQSYVVNAYNNDTVQLLGNVANQVAIAIQNARLIEEARQRGAELATLNQIISSATQSLDQRTLLSSVLQQTLEVFGFDGGLITLYNEARQKLERIVRTGLPGRIPDDPAEGLENSLCAYVFNSKAPLVIEDFRAGAPIDVSGEVESGYFSYMGLPLEARGHMLGTWCGFRKTAGPFGRNTFSLLQAVSQQLGFAIDNARLFQEAQRRASEQSVLFNLAQSLSAKLSIDQVLRQIYEGAAQLIDARNFYVGLYDPTKHETNFALTVAGSEVDRRIESLPAEQGITGYIIRTRQSLLINENVKAWLEEHGVTHAGENAQSYLGVPMVLGDQVLGALAVQNYTKPNAYTEHDRELLLVLGAQAAIAIQTARLFDEAQNTARREQTLREITARVRSSTDADAIARTAIRELGQALGRKTFIRLGDADQLRLPPQENPVNEVPASGNGHQTGAEGDR